MSHRQARLRGVEQSILPHIYCEPLETWSRSPSPPRGRWGGLCTHLHYRGGRPDPTVAFVPPAMHPAASSAHEGQLATAPPRRRHPGPCGRLGRRYRWWFGPPQPAGTMRIGHPCPSGRMCRSPWPQLFSVRTESHLRKPGRTGMGGRPWLGRRDAPHRWPGQCQHARRWPRGDTATAVSSQLRRRRLGWVLPAPRERRWLPRASEWARVRREPGSDLPNQPRTGSH